MSGGTNKRGAESNQVQRANLLRGFDLLPDWALIDVQTWAAVQDCSESTAWLRAKTDPDQPKLVKLSPRCTKVVVGHCREYLRQKVAA